MFFFCANACCHRVVVSLVMLLVAVRCVIGGCVSLLVYSFIAGCVVVLFVLLIEWLGLSC